MKKISLNGQWKMQKAGDNEWITATVPGTVYADLLQAKKMPDPFWKDNELQAMALMENDFIYERTFSVSADFLQCDAIKLCCFGLDTVAEITLNGKKLAHVDNMHRTWEFAVDTLLQQGENHLQIYFFSPLKEIRARYATLPAEGSEECTVGFPTLRKAHCQFGWDWGPRMPDAGIWRDITLVGYTAARLRTVAVHQTHSEGQVVLTLNPEIECLGTADITAHAVVTAPDGEKIAATYENGRLTATIKNPALWWPNGLGAQPLYTVCVQLQDEQGNEVDSWQQHIGLRTMAVERNKDEWGESFAHCVNGVSFFAMGADYIPEDSVLGRRTVERTRRLLEDCALANYNVIRVWGGGCYPDDWFFDICDELGLVVWQDYMFACAVYNLTPDFEESIMEELRDNITRIRHHACIGLLCGNNEMEMFVKQDKWVLNHGQKADYIKMYEYLFPKLTQQLAPQSFYWPASPSSGGSFEDPNAPDKGDVHFWEVWHGNKPFDEYQKHYFRYLSEFGFESFPCIKTIDSFAPKDEQNIFSYTMEKHQKKPGANGKIVSYLSQTYLYPAEFNMLVYASQLLQAEAVGYGVEHLRRHRGRCMGAVYWQVNDCWPVASWSSIDYFGRWKALHYYAKRFFAPVLLSAEVHSALTENPDINQENIKEEKYLNISVSNETKSEVTGTLHWQICTPAGQVLEKNSCSVKVEALSAQWVQTVQADAYPLFNTYVAYQLVSDTGTILGEKTELFCQPKYFEFANPQLSASIEGDEVVITAKAFAKSVCIESPDTDILLEDNYFDMQPGTRHVKIVRGTPQTITLASVYDIR